MREDDHRKKLKRPEPIASHDQVHDADISRQSDDYLNAPLERGQARSRQRAHGDHVKPQYVEGDPIKLASSQRNMVYAHAHGSGLVEKTQEGSSWLLIGLILLAILGLGVVVTLAAL